MKKTIALLLSVLLCVSMLCACAGNDTANKVSLFDLKEAMLAATSFGDMAYVSSEDQNAKTYLATVSDFDFEKVDAFSITYAKDGKGNADEIVVIRVKNPADTGDALATLQAHLKTRQSIYATYDPTQSEKIGKGVTFSKGAYAVLIVSDDNAAVKAAFDEHVK
jgi:hypothetical protein